MQETIWRKLMGKSKICCKNDSIFNEIVQKEKDITK